MEGKVGRGFWQNGSSFVGFPFLDLLTRFLCNCLAGLIINPTNERTGINRSGRLLIMAVRAGQQLSNYRLIRLLGRGSFVEVYLGEHIRLNTFAVIKVLNIDEPDLS